MRLGAFALLLVLTSAWDGSAAGVFEPREFATAEHEQRYRRLIAELRCLVCQNQNLADSGADLAADLRQQVFEMLDAGADDDAIVDFMVTRYGNFVRYRPPVESSTLVLWIGPFVLAALGLGLLRAQVVRRKTARAALSDAERRHLDRLLDT